MSQCPVDGHEYTGQFTAEEFLKRAEEHEKAARNGMAAGPNTSYTRTFQACAEALRYAAEHKFEPRSDAVANVRLEAVHVFQAAYDGISPKEPEKAARVSLFAVLDFLLPIDDGDAS